MSTEQIRSMDPMNLAYARLDDSLRILISGYLWKLSRSIMPTTTPGCASALVSKWSRRFFVLRADSCLYFFKKDQVCTDMGNLIRTLIVRIRLPMSMFDASKSLLMQKRFRKFVNIFPKIHCNLLDKNIFFF